MTCRASVRLLRLAVLIAFAACARPAQGPPSVEGTWNVAGATLGGRELPAAVFANTPLLLDHGRYRFQTDSGEYRVMPDASPAAMDVVGHKGPNAGKTIPTIFKMQGDTLVICYDLAGAVRPTEFASAAGSRHFLARYVRAGK